MNNHVKWGFRQVSLETFWKNCKQRSKILFQQIWIGKEIGLFNPIEVDRIVEILEGDGYVLNSEVENAEIRITDKGKERLENNQIWLHHLR